MMQHRRTLHRKRPRPLNPFSQTLTTPQPGLARGESGTPMRALTLIYHEDFESEITGIIQQKMLVARYTRVRDVVGARTDIMQDIDYQPAGSNHLLLIVATLDTITELAQALRELRQKIGHGLRGYITTVEGLI